MWVVMIGQEGRAGACGRGEEFVFFRDELGAMEGCRQRDRVCLGSYQDLAGCMWTRACWQATVE